MEETLYFAYGSNINLEQMEHRCPDAQLVGPVTLQNYELQFRGSGFATVSPKKGSVVHGLLWTATKAILATTPRSRYLCGPQMAQPFPSWLISWQNR